MYTLNKKWNNGKEFSIFGVSDVGDYSVIGYSNSYEAAMKNIKRVKDIENAERFAKVEGMKEGVLSAPIIYFEKDTKWGF
jgi:hypothetical protein